MPPHGAVALAFETVDWFKLTVGRAARSGGGSGSSIGGTSVALAFETVDLFKLTVRRAAHGGGDSGGGGGSIGGTFDRSSGDGGGSGFTGQGFRV